MKLTSKEINVMKSLYNDGVSISSISKAFNVAYESVKYQVVPGYKDVKRIRAIVRTTSDDKLISALTKYLEYKKR